MERYSYRLYIDIAKYKYSASSIGVPSIFLVHSMNAAQFLNATSVERFCPKILNVECKHHCNQRSDFNTSVLYTISFPTI